MEFLLDPPLGSVRYRVAHGGRGGTKSWNFARALLVLGATRKLRILCAREFQNSIKQSVKKTLEIQIEKMGMDGFYSISATEIVGRNGTEFIFHGLHHNIETIKSLEDIDVCWVEEAATISKESWEVLVPTIRKQGSEIWVSFNPKFPADPIYRLFCGDNPPANAIIREVSWRDNPFLSDTLREEREAMLERDPEGEAHVWGGLPWTRSDSQVLVKFVDGERQQLVHFEPFEVENHFEGPYLGADWGFSPDPTVLVKLWTTDSALYVEQEIRGVGWTVPDIDRKFREMPAALEHVIRADNARPEIIAQLRRDKLNEEGEVTERGLNIVAAKKWPGNVEDGIDHFRSYDRIIVDPSCSGIVQDTNLWRYKTDRRTGDVLPALVDGNDHGWDAARYALGPMIKKRPTWGLVE